MPVAVRFCSVTIGKEHIAVGLDGDAGQRRCSVWLVLCRYPDVIRTLLAGSPKGSTYDCFGSSKAEVLLAIAISRQSDTSRIHLCPPFPFPPPPGDAHPPCPILRTSSDFFSRFALLFRWTMRWRLGSKFGLASLARPRLHDVHRCVRFCRHARFA